MKDKKTKILEDTNTLTKEQIENAAVLDNNFKSLAATLSTMFEEVIANLKGVDTIGAKIAKSYERDIIGSIKRMSTGLDENVNLQLKINKGVNIQKELEEKQLKLTATYGILKAKLDKSNLANKEELKAELEKQNTAENNILTGLQEQNNNTQKSKGLVEELTESMGGYLDKIDKSGTLTAVLNGNWEFLKGNVKVLQMILMGVVKSLLTADKQLTAISNTLGTSGMQSWLIRTNMSATAFTANDLRVTSAALLKTNTELNKQYSTAAEFNKDILIGATKMLDKQVMSGEAVGQLSGDAARLGMTFDEAAKTQEDAVNSVNAQTGAQINLQEVLEDSNRVSGQIRAQLASNPPAIAKAITLAKSFGFELEQIAAAGKSMLDFESSISAELEAELLTGKQLNLEKARLAALTGDYETLTKEIAANVGDFNDFSKMNVLQQEAIAKSVGMTANDLADALVTDENRDQLMKDAIASGNKQSIQELQKLTTAENFAKVMEQLKGLVIDIAALFAPILWVVDMIAEGLGTWAGKIGMGLAGVYGLYKAYQALKGIQMATTIQAIFGANAKWGPLGIGLSIAAVAAMVGMISRYGSMNDGIIGSDGGMVVSGPKGSIQLNKEDSIIAGTNLGGGGGKSSGGEKIDYDKMASAMSKAKVNVSTQYDSFKANSSTANGGNYQSKARYESKFV